MNKIYYVSQKNRLEAMTTISFKSRINWLEEGLSILSWDYCLISDTELEDLKDIYSYFRRWKGNSNSKKSGHIGISLGDVIVTGECGWIIVGTGFQKIPNALFEKLNLK